MQTVDAVTRLPSFKVIRVNQVDEVAEKTWNAVGVSGHLVADIKQNEAPKTELRAASALKWPSEGCLEVEDCSLSLLIK